MNGRRCWQLTKLTRGLSRAAVLHPWSERDMRRSERPDVWDSVTRQRDGWLLLALVAFCLFAAFLRSPRWLTMA